MIERSVLLHVDHDVLDRDRHGAHVLVLKRRVEETQADDEVAPGAPRAADRNDGGHGTLWIVAQDVSHSRRRWLASDATVNRPAELSDGRRRSADHARVAEPVEQDGHRGCARSGFAGEPSVMIT